MNKKTPSSSSSSSPTSSGDKSKLSPSKGSKKKVIRVSCATPSQSMKSSVRSFNKFGKNVGMNTPTYIKPSEERGTKPEPIKVPSHTRPTPLKPGTTSTPGGGDRKIEKVKSSDLRLNGKVPGGVCVRGPAQADGVKHQPSSGKAATAVAATTTATTVTNVHSQKPSKQLEAAVGANEGGHKLRNAVEPKQFEVKKEPAHQLRKVRRIDTPSHYKTLPLSTADKKAAQIRPHSSKKDTPEGGTDLAKKKKVSQTLPNNSLKPSGTSRTAATATTTTTKASTLKGRIETTSASVSTSPSTAKAPARSSTLNKNASTAPLPLSQQPVTVSKTSQQKPEQTPKAATHQIRTEKPPLQQKTPAQGTFRQAQQSTKQEEEQKTVTVQSSTQKNTKQNELQMVGKNKSLSRTHSKLSQKRPSKLSRKCSKLMPTTSQRKQQMQTQIQQPQQVQSQPQEQLRPVRLMKSLTLSKCISTMQVRQGGDKKFIEFREPYGKLQERLNAWRDSLWFAPADLPEALKTIKFKTYYVPFILFSGKYIALENGTVRVSRGFKTHATSLPNYDESENPDLPFKKENVRDVGPWSFASARSLSEYQALVNNNSNNNKPQIV